MDIVFIQGLRIDTVIGIYDWERNTRQDIIFDIEMSFDNSVAARTDDIDKACVVLFNAHHHAGAVLNLKRNFPNKIYKLQKSKDFS